MKLVLLPGMDGTGDLFGPVLRALGDRVETLVLPLPSDGSQSQISLAKRLVPDLPDEEPYFLLGESFGGRIAFEIAAMNPPGLAGLILAASFLKPPRRHLLPLAAVLPTAKAISLPVFSGVARHMMLGRSNPEIWKMIQSVIADVPHGVIPARLRALYGLKEPTSHIDTRVFSLRANRDRLVDRAANASIARSCANVTELRVVGPHFLLQARPVECAEAIMDFIETGTP